MRQSTEICFSRLCLPGSLVMLIMQFREYILPFRSPAGSGYPLLPRYLSERNRRPFPAQCTVIVGTKLFRRSTVLESH